jgi:hypothetical protein
MKSAMWEADPTVPPLPWNDEAYRSEKVVKTLSFSILHFLELQFMTSFPFLCRSLQLRRVLLLPPPEET